ncbi:hypothetical protein AMTR_s00090p00053400 [Amborella trichopoda]|uniref:Uncharacterized protein n=1 Tax=Amborella trichopoda TaxID=13333 RepID=W1P1V6_AMBTC|nr:hypothetical protein AMTR_s00090p00053400 [Amborella trichopoda]
MGMYGGPCMGMQGGIGAPGASSTAVEGSSGATSSYTSNVEKTTSGMINGARHVMGRATGKWWYDQAIPFNAANNPYYPFLVAEIQKARPRVKPPTTYELCRAILDAKIDDV